MLGCRSSTTTVLALTRLRRALLRASSTGAKLLVCSATSMWAWRAPTDRLFWTFSNVLLLAARHAHFFNLCSPRVASKFRCLSVCLVFVHAWLAYHPTSLSLSLFHLTIVIPLGFVFMLNSRFVCMYVVAEEMTDLSLCTIPPPPQGSAHRRQCI